VRVILDAAARVLARDGYEKASTNRIAEKAGVSVGSLYQYFPNKDALVRALLEEHLADALARRPAALADSAVSLSLRERVGLAVQWHLDVHAANPALHQVLTQQAPRVLGEETLRRLERASHEHLEQILRPYRAELRPRDLSLAAFLYSQCLEAMTHGAVLHHPDRVKDPALAREMTELLVRFLEADPGSG
jgi:AcrR family transcriptional regulator